MLCRREEDVWTGVHRVLGCGLKSAAPEDEERMGAEQEQRTRNREDMVMMVGGMCAKELFVRDEEIEGGDRYQDMVSDWKGLQRSVSQLLLASSPAIVAKRDE